MTDKPDSSVPGYEAGKQAAELFGRMTRLLVYGNGGGVTACLLMAAATIQAGVYTVGIVAPLLLFWIGLVCAFWILAGLHTSAVARVAEQHPLMDLIAKRQRKVPILGWEFSFSDHLLQSGGISAKSMLASAVFFLTGSVSGFVLLLLV